MNSGIDLMMSWNKSYLQQLDHTARKRFCSLPFWRKVCFIQKIPRLICAETSNDIAGEGDKCVIKADYLAGSIQGLEATHEL